MVEHSTFLLIHCHNLASQLDSLITEILQVLNRLLMPIQKLFLWSLWETRKVMSLILRLLLMWPIVMGYHWLSTTRLQHLIYFVLLNTVQILLFTRWPNTWVDMERPWLGLLLTRVSFRGLTTKYVFTGSIRPTSVTTVWFTQKHLVLPLTLVGHALCLFAIWEPPCHLSMHFKSCKA